MEDMPPLCSLLSLTNEPLMPLSFRNTFIRISSSELLYVRWAAALKQSSSPIRGKWPLTSKLMECLLAFRHFNYDDIPPRETIGLSVALLHLDHNGADHA